jgi:hypothetical protein
MRRTTPEFVMSQRRDDTTDEQQRAPAKRERAPGDYYYDDATGYEVYDPTQDQDEADEDGVAPADTT